MSLITLSWVCGELQGRNFRFEKRASNFLFSLKCHVSGRFGDNINSISHKVSNTKKKVENRTHSGVFLQNLRCLDMCSNTVLRV